MRFSSGSLLQLFQLLYPAGISSVANAELFCLICHSHLNFDAQSQYIPIIFDFLKTGPCCLQGDGGLQIRSRCCMNGHLLSQICCMCIA